MNILEGYIMKRFELVLKSGIAYKDNPILFKDFKKSINNDLGIFYINYMKTKDKDVYTVMIKRHKKQYIYSYDLNNNTLTLKGERNIC